MSSYSLSLPEFIPKWRKQHFPPLSAIVALDDASVAKPPVRARRHERVPAPLAVQPVGSRRHKADARGSERVPKAQAAAVDVELPHGNFAQLGRRDEEMNSDRYVDRPFEEAVEGGVKGQLLTHGGGRLKSQFREDERGGTQ